MSTLYFTHNNYKKYKFFYYKRLKDKIENLIKNKILIII
jgi:hypothetical protein